MKSYGVTIQIKTTEQFILVVLLAKLFKLVLTFDPDEILRYNQ